MKALTALWLNIKASFFKVLSILGAFLLPIKPLLLIVGLTIMIDTVMGIYKAKKTGQEVTSRKASQVVTKMIMYQTAVILFFVMEKYILEDLILLFVSIPLFLTKIVAMVLISIELKSMDENYEAIKGISLWDQFKELLKRAKEVKDEMGELKK